MVLIHARSSCHSLIAKITNSKKNLPDNCEFSSESLICKAEKLLQFIGSHYINNLVQAYNDNFFIYVWMRNIFFCQGEIKGLEESKKLLEEENQKLLDRICALEDKQVLYFILTQ